MICGVDDNEDFDVHENMKTVDFEVQSNENVVETATKIAETPMALKIGEVSSISQQDLNSAEEKLFVYADTFEPVLLKTLYICPCCKGHLLTEFSVKKHIEMFHKIPIDIQEQMGVKIATLNLTQR